MLRYQQLQYAHARLEVLWPLQFLHHSTVRSRGSVFRGLAFSSSSGLCNVVSKVSRKKSG